MDEFFFFDFSGVFGISATDPIIDKAKTFRKELDHIDKKHSGFFNNEKVHLQDQKYDSIFNYCKVYIGYDPVRFIFTDNVVPEHIQKECFTAFKRVFG